MAIAFQLPHVLNAPCVQDPGQERALLEAHTSLEDPFGLQLLPISIKTALNKEGQEAWAVLLCLSPQSLPVFMVRQPLPTLLHAVPL